MFGNMSNHRPGGITLVWYFFGNIQGKNICDSQFSVLKNKLNQYAEGFQAQVEIYNYCIENLNDTIWPRTGRVLKCRQFFYQKDSVNIAYKEYMRIYCNDICLMRCVMWHSNGLFYRRFNS